MRRSQWAPAPLVQTGWRSLLRTLAGWLGVWLSSVLALCSGPLTNCSLPTGVLAPNHDEPPTSASRPPLPWIWKALVGSSSPRAGSQAVGESPEGQWLPMLKSLGVGTLAKAPQTLASSLGPEQGAGDLKPVPEPSWQVYHPTVPQGNTLLKPALPGAPALDGPFRGIPQDPDCSFCPQVGRGPSTQDGLGSQPVASLGNSPDFQLQTNDLV